MPFPARYMLSNGGDNAICSSSVASSKNVQLDRATADIIEHVWVSYSYQLCRPARSSEPIRRLQRKLDLPPNHTRVLQPDTDPYEMLNHSVPSRPLPLPVMREQRIRTTKREIST